MATVGNLLKIRRAELGLSAKVVAQEIGVAESTYRDWENGRKIQGEPYVMISQVLSIPVSTLLGSDKVSSNQIISELEELELRLKLLKEQVMSSI